jgi:hypothetical protein
VQPRANPTLAQNASHRSPTGGRIIMALFQQLCQIAPAPEALHTSLGHQPRGQSASAPQPGEDPSTALMRLGKRRRRACGLFAALRRSKQRLHGWPSVANTQ